MTTPSVTRGQPQTVDTPLAGVKSQSAKASIGLPKDLQALVNPLPYLYEATGDETMFTGGVAR